MRRFLLICLTVAIGCSASSGGPGGRPDSGGDGDVDAGPPPPEMDADGDGISDGELDEWYETGRNAGALGGKLLGAGRGGFMMFFAPPERHAAIVHALPGLREIRFRFDTNGSQIIFYRP